MHAVKTRLREPKRSRNEADSHGDGQGAGHNRSLSCRSAEESGCDSSIKSAPRSSHSSERDKESDGVQAACDAAYDIFGLSLDSAVAINDEYLPQPCVYFSGNPNMPAMKDVPYLVLACVDHIAQHITEPGLYRVCGSSSQVRALRKRFTSDGPTFAIRPDDDVHAVTTVLKQYLRELPVDLLPIRNKDLAYDRLDLKPNRHLNIKTAALAVRELRTVMAQIPYSHYALLKLLVAHLRDVIDHDKSNLMTLDNVTLILSQSLRVSQVVLKILVLVDPLADRQPLPNRRYSAGVIGSFSKGGRDRYSGAFSSGASRRWSLVA